MIESESTNFSNDIMDKVCFYFAKCFPNENSALFSWGSTARREMGRTSDLDLIIIYEGKDVKKRVGLFFQLVRNDFPHIEFDLLQKFSVSELVHIAKIDGSDREAITLSRLETENNHLSNAFKTKVSAEFTNPYERIRELVHMILNLTKVYPYLYSPNNIKFGLNGLRYINYAFLFCRYIFNDVFDVVNTNTALERLAQSGIISAKLASNCMIALKFLLDVRDFPPEPFYVKDNTLFTAHKDTTDLSEAFATSLRHHKENINELTKILIFRTIDIVSKEIGSQEAEILRSGIINNEHLKNNPEDIINSEFKSLIFSYCSSDKHIHRRLYEKFLYNWYILYGLANNRSCDPDILNNLVKTDGKSKKLLRVHQDFSWRNIYLYVAKNPSSDLKTLNTIIDYKNARPMDIEAARRSILLKENNSPVE